MHRIGVLGNRQADRARELIALALNVIAECEVWIELRINLLWLCSIEHRRTLVDAGTTRSSWSAVLTSVAGYLTPGFRVCSGE